MGLDDVASAWGRTVSYGVLLRELNVVLQHLFVLNCRVLQTDQPLCGRDMTFITWTLPIVLLHDLVEVSCCIFVTFGVYFFK